MRLFHILIPLASCVAITTAAQADEAWQTEFGEVFYVEDIGNTAAFALVQGDYEVTLFIDGLADNLDARGVHRGVWAGGDYIECGTTLTAPDGVEYAGWGQLVVAFTAPSFPAPFIAFMDNCNDGSFEKVEAAPS